MLKPFFTFYGGKWRAAPKYPAPEYATIIEPFAGSAGYSMRYPEHQVMLYDADPIIAGLWQYLIGVSAREIRSLPLLVSNVDSLPVCQEARWLIGFWLNKGVSTPCKTPSAWMRSGIRPASFWGEEIRERIASQVDQIRHWRVEQADYLTVPNQEATWFIDPPYVQAGKYYRYRQVDYARLALYCRERRGQVIVCENTGASWLPFSHFMNAKSMESKHGGKVSAEALWTNADA